MATLTSIQNLRSIGYREVRFPDPPHFSQNDVSIPIVYLSMLIDALDANRGNVYRENHTSHRLLRPQVLKEIV